MERHPIWRGLLHGGVGGAIAGTVVAVWFFLVDIATTEPFWTPAVLASVVLNEEFMWPTVRLVASYTVLHYGVFALLGILAVWFLTTVDVAPGLLVGVVFGIGVLNGVHYGGLLVTDANLLTVLPVGHVLAANLAGGMAMMAYLHRALHAAQPLGPRVLERHPLLLRGIGTGLLGAGAVALWLLIVDIMTSIPFYTPAALGSALFLGATSAAEVQLNFSLVAAYTFVHVVAFVVAGVVFVWVAERIERAPGFWLLAFMAFVVLEALFVASAGLFSEWVLGVLGWWAVGIGNAVAVGVMGWWVWRTHPLLQEQFTGRAVETQV